MKCFVEDRCFWAGVCWLPAGEQSISCSFRKIPFLFFSETQLLSFTYVASRLHSFIFQKQEEGKHCEERSIYRSCFELQPAILRARYTGLGILCDFDRVSQNHSPYSNSWAKILAEDCCLHCVSPWTLAVPSYRNVNGWKGSLRKELCEMEHDHISWCAPFIVLISIPKYFLSAWSYGNTISEIELFLLVCLLPVWKVLARRFAELS